MPRLNSSSGPIAMRGWRCEAVRLPFSLFDFLGYALPGFIVIILIILITAPSAVNLQSQIDIWLAWIQKLVNPNSTLANQQNSAEIGIIKYLPSNIAWSLFLVVFCYLVGFILHGISDFCFKFMSGEYICMSDMFKRMKKYYTDNGWFEKELFDCLRRGCRDPSELFDPYSKQFIHKLKGQIAEVFEIEVDSLERSVEYTEIFHLCRGVVIKQNPDLYSRASTLQSRHESAKLMMFIFFVTVPAFLVKSFFFDGGSLSLSMAFISSILVIIFCYMYTKVWTVFVRMMPIFKASLIFLWIPYKNPTQRKINANQPRRKPQRGEIFIETPHPQDLSPSGAKCGYHKKLSKV